MRPGLIAAVAVGVVMASAAGAAPALPGFSVKSDGTSANAPASTKDVVPYGVRLSNYKGLSIATVNSPDIGFSRKFTP